MEQTALCKPQSIDNLMGLFDLFKKGKNDLGKQEQVEGNLLENTAGSNGKLIIIKQQKLADGSFYSGEATPCANGFYLPNGFGKKIVNEDLELTGCWKDGNINGVCYKNMHHSMITGHFIKNQPQGWCLSIGKGQGADFGVFKKEKCVRSLVETVSWMLKSIDYDIKFKPNKRMVFVGNIMGLFEGDKDYIARGFHFMNNGEIYVGMDTSQFEQTGFFFKFTQDGHIQIGLFEHGALEMELEPKEVIQNCFHDYDPTWLSLTIDTNKKYF